MQTDRQADRHTHAGTGARSEGPYWHLTKQRHGKERPGIGDSSSDTVHTTSFHIIHYTASLYAR